MNLNPSELDEARKRKGQDQPILAASESSQETIDPFDYAETIVRDLSLHVGSRLRDFRSDLAAMHSAVVQLPETMKINALGQSIQDLRERLAHLTGVVSQQVARYPEELERVSKMTADLLNRVAGLESWIASIRHSMAQGEAPTLPLPTGGFVGQDQFAAALSQAHENLMRVVGAVRDMQLDLRDLRSDWRQANGQVSPPPAAPPAPVPAVAPVPGPHTEATGLSAADLEPLHTRLEVLHQRLKTLEGKVAAPAPGSGGDIASLVLAAWPRLVAPSGSETLRQATEAALQKLTARMDRVVRMEPTPKGPGLIAIGLRQRSGRYDTVLAAAEDLCGRSWSLAANGLDMTALDGERPATRVSCWHPLLAAAALLRQSEPKARVLPLLIYGNGQIDRLPPRSVLLEYGQRLGVGDAAAKLTLFGASDCLVADIVALDDLTALLADF
jgi:hypothetical protein